MSKVIKDKATESALKCCLDAIYTDLLMLQDGSWEPDESSIEASINTVDTIGNILGIRIKDMRDEN